MPSSGMWRYMTLVRTDVSENRIASFISVKGISKLRLLVTAKVVPNSPIVILIMEALCASETSVITGVARWNIPEDGILHSRCRENLRSCK
jgi:hypothetical protein